MTSLYEISYYEIEQRTMYHIKSYNESSNYSNLVQYLKFERNISKN